MSDPFFVTPSTGRKRTGGFVNNKNKKKPIVSKNKKISLPQATPKTKNSALEEDLSENSDLDKIGSSENEDSESDNETAEEKRLRLAKQYIQSLKDGLPEDELEVDAKEIDEDIIASRLEKDALESANQLFYKLTDQFPSVEELETKFKKAHQNAVTAVVTDAQNGFIYTASKDSSIIQWDLETLQKKHTFPGGRKGLQNFKGHTGHILTLALSHDGKLLASGGTDKLINIWDLSTLSLKGSLKHHKDSVSGLVFRQKSYDLYSCSFDRTVKVWNIEAMAYVETLFGHQDMIFGIGALAQEHCITVGGRDRTLRLWRIVEQTQLVFRGGNTTRINDSSDDSSESTQFIEGSLDKLAMLDEGNFVTGGDSGSLCLWNTSKKKPVNFFPVAHGLSPINRQPYGISALATVPYTDLVISGSSDGFLRLWKTGLGSKRVITPLMTIPMPGFINSIDIATKDPKHHKANSKDNNKPIYHLTVGLGQESAYGRWERITKARNQIAVVNIPLKALPKTL